MQVCAAVRMVRLAGNAHRGRDVGFARGGVAGGGHGHVQAVQHGVGGFARELAVDALLEQQVAGRGLDLGHAELAVVGHEHHLARLRGLRLQHGLGLLIHLFPLRVRRSAADTVSVAGRDTRCLFGCEQLYYC